jgi:putative tryptophan/tyrosine transport system substrate-binding protein
MGKSMKRRDFVLLFGSAALTPRAAFAQATTNRRPRIAYFSYGAKGSPLGEKYRAQFLSGMRDLGYVEGQDFEMLYRYADFQPDRLPQVAKELVELKPDVIVGGATIAAVVLKKETDTVPIVIGALADPVELGLIKSYARPGGNVTGIMPYVGGLPTKQLDLARELVKGATRIGLLDDPIDPKARPQAREIMAAGDKLNIKIIPAAVRSSDDVVQAYELFSREGAEVIVVEQSNMLIFASQQIAEAAAAAKLPTVYGYHEHVEAGGLISYGVDLDWCFRRLAYYVDKILKGAKPSELPVEFPTTLEMCINLEAANALGLTISPALLVQADKIIE